jgi:hypothetical protein
MRSSKSPLVKELISRYISSLDFSSVDSNNIGVYMMMLLFKIKGLPYMLRMRFDSCLCCRSLVKVFG